VLGDAADRAEKLLGPQSPEPNESGSVKELFFCVCINKQIVVLENISIFILGF